MIHECKNICAPTMIDDVAARARGPAPQGPTAPPAQGGMPFLRKMARVDGQTKLVPSPACAPQWPSKPAAKKPLPRKCTRGELSPQLIAITSTSTSSLMAAKDAKFAASPLARPLGVPLFVYHEYTLDQHFGRPAAAAWKHHLEPELAMRDDVCTIDLFESVRGLLELIVSPSSCIDAFYRIAGRREPFGDLSVSTAKLLVRKVASIFHALEVAPPHAVVVWLDFDVDPRRPLSTKAFHEFVAGRDLTYIPFASRDRTPREAHARASQRGHDQPLASIDDALRWPEAWSVDTGVLAIARRAATRDLIWQLMRHYDGGAVLLAERCLCGHHLSSLPCNETWMQANLYLDE